MHVRNPKSFDDKMAEVRAAHGQAPAAAPATSISERAAASAQRAAADASSFRAAVMGLPEAKERQKAAARLADLYPRGNLPLDRAAAILAGLPLENGTAAPKRVSNAPSVIGGDIEATMQRRAELLFAALSHNGGHNPLARGEAKKLNYALSIRRETPAVSIFAALKAAGFDGRRISEIYDGARS